jgi:Iron-binding zinc finger CDGSH type
MTASGRGPDEPSAVITPYPDGPLIVRGDFELCELDGTPIPRSGRVVALCRCGRSAVKPFCDGSHKRAARPRSPLDDAASVPAADPAAVA